MINVENPTLEVPAVIRGGSKRWLPRLLVLLAATSLPTCVLAESTFAGKTISFLVSSDPGGGYDSYSRLLARYIPKYLPGEPTVVVQNMPGAGGLRVAQHLYSVVEKDGTKVGNLRASNMLDAVLGIRGSDIDPRKFEWIGNMASDTDVCSFWHTSGVTKFEDLRSREILMGASGKGGQNYMFPNAINHVLGTKMKMILGYKGMGDRILALQHGEIQGNCGMNASSLTSLQPELLAKKQLVPVVQSGVRPYPAFKDLPMTQSFARDERERKILNTIFSQMDIARTFALAPGTPSALVKTWRGAFEKAMQDPGLIEEAGKQKLDLNMMAGAEVTKVFTEMAELPSELKKDVRAAIED